jgi:hypothetical protein
VGFQVRILVAGPSLHEFSQPDVDRFWTLATAGCGSTLAAAWIKQQEGSSFMAHSKLAAVMAMLIAMFLIFTVPASASALLTGTGTGAIGLVSITTVRSADGNVIQERHLAGTVAGTLQGTFVEDVRGVIHPSGLVTFEGTLNFTGTVADCGSGSLTLGVSGQGVTGAPVTESKVRVIDSASNTIAAHGVGTVSQSGPSLTYEIQYKC